MFDPEILLRLHQLLNGVAKTEIVHLEVKAEEKEGGIGFSWMYFNIKIE